MMMMIDWSKPLVAILINPEMDSLEVPAKVGQLNAGINRPNWVWVYHTKHPNRPNPEGVWFDTNGFSAIEGSRPAWKLRNEYDRTW